MAQARNRDDDLNADRRQRVADARQASIARAEAANRMMDSSQPTPTQEENDLIRAGVDLPEKEDDGSGPDFGEELQRRRMAVYEEAAGESGEESAASTEVRRGRGRPRKTEEE